MLSKITGLAALAALAAANDASTTSHSISIITPSPDPCPTICADGVNECGVPFGGCYNVCSETQPTAPPCTKTGTNTHTISTITVPHDPCAKICVDGVNKCGVAWGDCYNPCTGPTPSPPPCSLDSTTTTSTETGGGGGACKPPTKTGTATTPPPPPPTTSTATPTSSVDNCSTRTVCVDLVNECGMWYGGCIPDCKPWPTFSKPVCPSTTSFVTSTRTETSSA